MAKSHRMTPKRRTALRKAQAASARKRKGRAAPKKQSWGDRNAGALSLGVSLAGAVGIGYMQYKFDQADAKAERYRRGSAAIRAAATERRHRRMNYASRSAPKHRFSHLSARFGNSRHVGSIQSPFSHHGGKTKLRRWGTGGGKNRKGKKRR